jgi:hypothetical protein
MLLPLLILGRLMRMIVVAKLSMAPSYIYIWRHFKLSTKNRKRPDSPYGKLAPIQARRWATASILLLLIGGSFEGSTWSHLRS